MNEFLTNNGRLSAYGVYAALSLKVWMRKSHVLMMMDWGIFSIPHM